MFHPRKNEQGGLVKLKSPSTPTPLSTWAQPGSVARVIPDGDMPAEVNGLAIAPWSDAPTTAGGWEALASTQPLDEPPFVAPAGYKRAAGAVVCEPDGRVWVVAPSNAWAGYLATFPKGTMEGKSTQATALAEVFEEAGLQIRLTKFLLDVKRTDSFTRYFMAERLGGNPAKMCWESQAVMLVPRSALPQVLNSAKDVPIIEALQGL
jgi:8-oxo-dGTP pyrophosphatase MutT (NUDIX family)